MFNNLDYRTESDSMGTVNILNTMLWGAQTQRSLDFFSIGKDLIPIELIHALSLVKKAAAITNNNLSKLSNEKKQLIIDAADEIISGKYDKHFPLRVWTSGSGTQTNMNVNEVIANLCNQKVGNALGSKKPIHPNDDVNMSQSTNDIFPTAMHVSIALAVNSKLLPSLDLIQQELQRKVDLWKNIIKIGRTHMQDAVPMTLGQQFSAYKVMLEQNTVSIKDSLIFLYELAAGGTAVGTGLNAPKNYDTQIALNIAQLTKLPFTSAKNKFAAQASHTALVKVSSGLRELASSLYKIANDIRLLSSGPRAGINELIIPENEPGSSIMPGKVNPTQCESITMVALQVMAYDMAVALGNSSGMLEMNVYKPLIAYNILQSIQILSDSIVNFNNFLLLGTKPNMKRINLFLNNSLMLVTALNPIIGYDKASRLAHYANEHDCSLAEANIELGFLNNEELLKALNPDKMV